MEKFAFGQGATFLQFILCIAIACNLVFSYTTQGGYFLPSETILSGDTYQATEIKGGSTLGSSSGGTYETQTNYGPTAEDADVAMIERIITVSAPAAQGYTGGTTDIVPGSKITISMLLENQNNVTANNYLIRDLVPANTHLYYTQEPPTMNGDIENVTYQGSTENSGPDSVVEFEFDLLPSGSATFSYTVTVD